MAHHVLSIWQPQPNTKMIKSTIQLLAATFTILTIASCTVNVDPAEAGATTTTTTTTDNPYVLGDRTTTTQKTTKYKY